MEIAPRLRKLAIRGLLPLVAALPLQARVATIEMERLAAPLANGENVSLTLRWPDGASAGELELRARRLAIEDTPYSFRNLRWTCAATRAADGALACSGELRVTGAPASTLAARWRADTLDLQLTQAKTRVGIRGSMADPVAWQVTTKRVPAAWLKPLLADLWPATSLTGGQFDADWSIRNDTAGNLVAGGATTLRAFGLDTSDGAIAAADLVADGRIELHTGATARVDGTLALRGGELLLGSVYASLPPHDVALEWRLANTSGTRWSIERFSWRDPGALDLQATGAFDTAAASPLHTLAAAFSLPNTAVAIPRYFDSLLGTVGLAGLRTRGALRGEVSIADGTLDRLELAPSSLTIDDANQRFGIEALDGTVRLQSGANNADSTLAWHSANVHGITLGAATLPLRSRDLGIALASPATVPALGGRIAISRFAWRPDSAGSDAGLDLAFDLRDIDLQRLSTALGWPAFPGTLSGEIPGVRYADSVIDIQGGLAMHMFDGDVRIDQLTLERPFGVAPTMTGAIAFTNLDLKPLTSAFGFGEITGRLGGHVRNLRLVDWEPVAFEARFETSTKAKDPRRISQRAVRELTEVGGGGIAAGLQAQVLKVFQTFGYARIGLSCTLANDVCTMGGLDGGDGRYTIVEGSGLPRVSVIGHQRRVDWPVLVARLKAATEGQAPIID